jgi:nitrile hydratase accessory protein
MGSTLICSMTT